MERRRAAGPQGPQGEQGPQGPEGPPGQDGEDGSVSGYEVVSATDPNGSPSALCSSGKSPLGGGFLTFGGQTFAWQPILSLGTGEYVGWASTGPVGQQQSVWAACANVTQ